MAGTKRKQAESSARKNWRYINVPKKSFLVAEKILKTEGEAMNIVDVPELFRTVITMFVLEWQDGHNFAEAKRRTFDRLSPTIKDANRAKFLVWSALEQYIEEETKRIGLRSGSELER